MVKCGGCLSIKTPSTLITELAFIPLRSIILDEPMSANQTKKGNRPELQRYQRQTSRCHPWWHNPRGKNHCCPKKGMFIPAIGTTMLLAQCRLYALANMKYSSTTTNCIQCPANKRPLIVCYYWLSWVWKQNNVRPVMKSVHQDISNNCNIFLAVICRNAKGKEICCVVCVTLVCMYACMYIYWCPTQRHGDDI